MKRLLSVLLCLTLIIGLLPAMTLTASAATKAYVGQELDITRPYEAKTTYEYRVNDTSVAKVYLEGYKGGKPIYKMRFLKPGKVELYITYSKDAGGRVPLSNTSTYKYDVVYPEPVQDVTIRLDSGSFAGGKEFPEFTVPNGATYYVEEATFYREMVDYYTGDKLPSYSAGATISNVIVTLKPKNGYFFGYAGYQDGKSHESAVYTVEYKGKKYKPYVVHDYIGNELEVYLDVTVEEGSVYAATIRDLDAPYHGGPLDKTVTTYDDVSLVSVRYLKNGKEAASFSKGDKADIVVRLKTKSAKNTFDEKGYAYWYEQKLSSVSTKLISPTECEYTFQYTAGAAPISDKTIKLDSEPFYSGGIFPEITVPADANYTVEEAFFYKEMASYYAGDKLPGYAPGTVISYVDVTLKPKANYKFAYSGEADGVKHASDIYKVEYKGKTYIPSVRHDDTNNELHVYIDVTLEKLEEKTEKEITTAKFSVAEPKSGETPKNSATSLTEGVKVTSVEWTRSDGKAMDAKFDGGTNYNVKISFEPADGYKYASDFGNDVSKVSINGVYALLRDANNSGGGKDKYEKKYYATVTLKASGEPLKKEENGDKTDEGKTDEGGQAGQEAPEDYKFPFTDVPSTQWYYESVRDAHKMGLINGKSATLYKPNDNMTVAEAVKLAVCMNILYYGGDPNKDIGNGTDKWYSTYMKYALDKGIIDSDLSPRANEKITRKEYVYIFSRSLPKEAFPEKNTIPAGSIPDVKEEKTAQDKAIYLFYRAGILSGSDSKGTFNPGNNIKRSEVAAILIRMMDETARVGAPADLKI